ncbi:OLC1v1012706C5 [Oldenlandia corymbosa var. corymbosa]|nr:OLC1v1012706C5 [Oldenlandia corymbosa var. corymbosa]
MGRKPGFFYDIGRKARELLYRDYVHQPENHYSWGYVDCSCDVRCNVPEMLPGLGAIVRVYVPYQRLSEVEIGYLYDFVGITMGASMTNNPLVNFSGVLGYSRCYIGTAIAFDTQVGQLLKCDGGLNFKVPFLRAALQLKEKGGTLSASCYTKPLRDAAFAAEVTHRFADKLTTIQLGSQYEINEALMIKGRVSTDGDIGALLQLQFFNAVYLTFGGEINVKDVNSARMGIACALKYEIPHIASGKIKLPISIGEIGGGKGWCVTK